MLTELARRAAEAGTGRNLGVDYRLIQSGSILDALTVMGSSAPLTTLNDPVGGQLPMPVSQMTAFRAGGLGAVSCTWASAGPTHVDPPTEAPDVVLHSGRAVLNPNFLHDTTAHIELMLTFGTPPWRPNIADSMMLTKISHALLTLAAKVGSVLFMHCPVAPVNDPPRAKRGDGSYELPRDAQGPCLRMSVGVESREPQARLDFELNVTRLAERLGLGLRIGDRRFARARGEWFSVRSFDRQRYAATRDELFPGAAARSPRLGYVLSSVGPAKSGVALAIAEHIQSQNDCLLGMSVSALQGVGFVNYFLALDGEHRDRTEPPTSLAQGYTIIRGPVQRCYFPSSSRRTGAGKDARAPYPLWVAWEVPGSAYGALEVLDAVSTRIADNVDEHRLLYAQSRLVSPELMRGRAKFSVVLPEGKQSDEPTPAQEMLRQLADNVEDATFTWLARELGLSRGRCRVSGKERWLRYPRTIR